MQTRREDVGPRPIIIAIARVSGTGQLPHVPTTSDEVKTLLAAVYFSRCGTIVDTWAGTHVIAEMFGEEGYRVVMIRRELQEDALQPAFHRKLLREHGRIDAFVVSPWFSFLDMAVPLALAHAARTLPGWLGCASCSCGGKCASWWDSHGGPRVGGTFGSAYSHPRWWRRA